MAVNLPMNKIRFDVLAEALRHEVESGATDTTKSIRVRHGIYSLRGKPGKYIIRIRVPTGVLMADQLETVAALAEESGWTEGAHLTTRQGIEIAGLPAAEIASALERLDAVGLTALRTGGPFVRGVAKRFHDRPVPHYALLLGGISTAEKFATHVLEIPAINVARAVREVVGFYQEARQPAESFATFVGRTKLPAFQLRLERLTRVPVPAEEPDFYRDLGSTENFSVGARGGECAA